MAATGRVVLSRGLEFVTTNVVRYLCEGSPVIRDAELIRVLVDMIVGVLEKGAVAVE